MEEGNFKVSFNGVEYNGAYIKSAETAQEVLAKLMQKDCLFGLDTETEALDRYKFVTQAGLSPHLAKIRLLQIFDGENTIVFDLKHINADSLFIPFLESKRFIAHNAIFDLQFLKNLGIKNISLGCTLILFKLLHHATTSFDDGTSASLDALCKSFFDIDLGKQLQASAWETNELTYEQIEYAALDPIACYKIAEKLAKGITKFGLERIYNLSKDAQHPIADMQMNGMLLDEERHKKMISVWRTKLYAAKKELCRLTGLTEITNHKMADWLESKLPREVLLIWPRTDKGKLSTDSHTFVEFSYLDIVKPFTEFQRQEKLCSSFGNNLIAAINVNTKRLHSGYRICGARTGRLSCYSPNLQQMPRDKDVRQSFIASPGCELVIADYSQIELRVAAELSRDPMMLKAYREGIDLHAMTASQIAHKPIDKVTKEERQMAKSVNFGNLFGIGAKKFAHYAKKSYHVDLDPEEASDAIKGFRKTYSTYRSWQTELAETCAEELRVRTPCGKLRCLDATNYYGASANTQIQGGAAECMLYALCEIKKSLDEAGLKAKLSNCVHDEIIIDTPLNEVDSVKFYLKEAMTTGFLSVFPRGITHQITSASSGPSWGEAKG